MPETPLSDKGIAQARLLGARMRDAGLVRLLASDLSRARMTAEAIAETTGLEPEWDDIYQERNFGDIRGTAYAALSTSPFAPGYEPPGGESWERFDERVDLAWARMRAAADAAAGPIAVVTHGLVCHSIVSRYIEGVASPGAEAGPLRFGNTSVSVLRPDASGVTWRADPLDCTSHLAGEAADDGVSPSGL